MTTTINVEPLAGENGRAAYSEEEERAFLLWILGVRFVVVPENLVSQISTFTLPQLEIALRSAMVSHITLTEFTRSLQRITSNA